MVVALLRDNHKSLHVRLRCGGDVWERWSLSNTPQAACSGRCPTVLPDLEPRSKPEPPRTTSSPSRESPDAPMQIHPRTHCSSKQAAGSNLSRRISPLPERENPGATPFAARRRRQRADPRAQSRIPEQPPARESASRWAGAFGFGEREAEASGQSPPS